MFCEIQQTKTFAKWFEGIKDLRAKQVVLARITAIRSDGHFGDHKRLSDGIFELRIFVGKGYRVYYTLRGKQGVLLLAGGIKDSQARDLAKAKAVLKNLEE